jgi:hypothetical protein
MRRLNGTTMTGGSAVFGMFAGGFFQSDLPSADTYGWICASLGGLLFLFGWVLPRVFGARRSELSGDEAGAPTNRLGAIDVRANLKRKSGGGIDLNASISTGADSADDKDATKEEKDPGGD